MPRRGKKTINQVKMRRLRNDLNKIKQRIERMNLHEMFVHRCLDEQMKRLLQLNENGTDSHFTCNEKQESDTSTSYVCNTNETCTLYDFLNLNPNKINNSSVSSQNQFHDSMGQTTSRMKNSTTNSTSQTPNIFYNSTNTSSTTEDKTLTNQNVDTTPNKSESNGILFHHFNLKQNEISQNNFHLQDTDTGPISVLGYNQIPEPTYNSIYFFRCNNTQELPDNQPISVLGYNHQNEFNFNYVNLNQALRNNLASPHFSNHSMENNFPHWCFQTTPIIRASQLFLNIEQSQVLHCINRSTETNETIHGFNLILDNNNETSPENTEELIEDFNNIDINK